MGVLLGNVSQRLVYNNGPLGAGVKNTSNGPGHIEIHGKAGDWFVLADDEVMIVKQANAPIVMQAVGNSVTVEFTLVNPAMAKNRDPAVQAQVPWVNSTTVTVGPIVAAPITNFSCMKITFAATADFYIVGR